MSQPHVIVLSGPTAVGKTNVSVWLANLLQTEIISADSRQLYKELTIGTAKPTITELAKVPHHFIDHCSIHQAVSAGKYEQLVLQFLESYFKTNAFILLVGGSSLYIDAVCKGLHFFPPVGKEIKISLQNDLETHGLSYLQEELKQRDPESYHHIDLQNSRRVCRALEVIRQTNRTFSSFKKQQKKKRTFECLYIQLDRDRKELYDRINLRVDQMIRDGLEQEAKRLYKYRDLKPLQTVGYREWWPYFEGEIDFNTVVNNIKQHSRNYAKRQLTWFRKKSHWYRCHPDDRGSIISYLQTSASLQSILK